LGEKGIVFDIQRFSISDGPGIRTLVFLKGCPLSCVWCSNPESQRPMPELFFHPQKCIDCGNCITACKNGAIYLSQTEKIIFDRTKCVNCGECAKVCYSNARIMKGALMTVNDVIKEVVKDKDFYKSNSGGVTLSGGEPLCNMSFSAKVLKGCKLEGIHTAIETAGCVPWAAFENVIEFTDLFLFDIKHMDSKTHKKFTSVDNEMILDNLKRLSKRSKDIIVRTAVIPGFNNSEESIMDISEYLSGLGITEYHIMPYHRYGIGKYQLLGRQYSFRREERIDDKEIFRFKAAAEKYVGSVLIV